MRMRRPRIYGIPHAKVTPEFFGKSSGIAGYAARCSADRWRETREL